jgi:hypothetical protein
MPPMKSSDLQSMFHSLSMAEKHTSHGGAYMLAALESAQ